MKKWSMDELFTLYHTPLLELIAKAGEIHGQFHEIGTIQLCTLISIKTGGCSEDCKYCAQSSRYKTNIKATPLMKREEVLAIAQAALARGSSRLCMGAAWREARDSRGFDEILAMIKEVSELGLEVCCCLGMLTEPLAAKLKEAGLYAYNHNLDSSESFYKTIISTRTYSDRLETLKVAENAGLSLCCGGIFGMGEGLTDRLELIYNLCNREKQPESFPVNLLMQMEGTPLGEEKPKPLSTWELVRTIATARICMPRAVIRLGAGRKMLSQETQTLCFLAGVNSIFSGDKLLTAANNTPDSDEELFTLLGLKKRRVRQ